MTDHDERWADVAAAINQRLTERAWHQADLVRESGVSAFTVRRLMQGSHQNYREANLGRVSRALWGDQAVIRRILEGTPPSGRSAEQRDDERSPVEVEILRDPGLTPDQQDLLIVAYRGAITRTLKARSGEVDGEQHGFG